MTRTGPMGVTLPTTEFTEPAADLARRHGITLIDG